jgi:mono/diheme cytochrome c family protein
MKFALRVFACLFFLSSILHAQTQPTPSQQASTKGLKLDTGEEIFKASCIGCHGPDGAGQPQTILGFEPPPAFPDFTDCNGSTREKTSDWSAIIHEGGPARGFSDIMPSWKEALTTEQINKVMEFLRSRCEEPGWPLGELNLPRALFTEKAFPEDEWVLMSTVNTNGPGEVSNKFVYEKRFGRRNMVEIVTPFSFLQNSNNSWSGGIGDVVFGYKRVVFSLGTSTILSAQGEVSVPTGNDDKGFGLGLTKFETFAALGQNLSRSSFIQIQTGFELPVDTTTVPNAYFFRSTVGKILTPTGRAGRAWIPMVEFLAERELGTGATTDWDIVPEMQVTLSKRQHIRANVGVRTPLNNRTGRPTQLAFYLLWDFFDGGLQEGW